jgi:hypothetical protein
MTEPTATAAPDPRPPTPIGLGMVPGSAELVVYILALVLAMLVTWISDEMGTAAWLDFFKWSTAAYLLSRGIAKASRVFEY